MEDEIKKKQDITEYWNYRKECKETVDNWKCSNLVGDDDDDAVEQFLISVERRISVVDSYKKIATNYKLLVNKHKDDLRNEIDLWKRIQDLLRPEREKAMKAYNERVDTYYKTMEEIIKIPDIKNLVESDGFVGSESETCAFNEAKDELLRNLISVQLQNEINRKSYDGIIEFVKRHNLESVLEKDEVIPEDVICWALGRDPPPPKEENSKENYKELMSKLRKMFWFRIQLLGISSAIKCLLDDIRWLIIRTEGYLVTENKREREDDESSTSGLKNWKSSCFLNEAQYSEEEAMRVD